MAGLVITVENILNGKMPRLPRKIQSTETVELVIEQTSPDLSRVRDRHLQTIIKFIDNLSASKVKVIFQGRKVAPEFLSLLNTLSEKRIQCGVSENPAPVVELGVNSQESEITQLKQQVASLTQKLGQMQTMNEALKQGNQALRAVLTQEQLDALVLPRIIHHSEVSDSFSQLQSTLLASFKRPDSYNPGMFNAPAPETASAAPATGPGSYELDPELRKLLEGLGINT